VLTQVLAEAAPVRSLSGKTWAGQSVGRPEQRLGRADQSLGHTQMSLGWERQPGPGRTWVVPGLGRVEPGPGRCRYVHSLLRSVPAPCRAWAEQSNRGEEPGLAEHRPGSNWARQICLGRSERGLGRPDHSLDRSEQSLVKSEPETGRQWSGQILGRARLGQEKNGKVSAFAGHSLVLAV
jgi:hypothetical protein